MHLHLGMGYLHQSLESSGFKVGDSMVYILLKKPRASLITMEESAILSCSDFQIIAPSKEST